MTTPRDTASSAIKANGPRTGSTALEANIRDYKVEVTIDKKYSVLLEVMSGYYGLSSGLNNFLEELSHPYRNWEFIVGEARRYSLDYYHLLINHPRGPEAAQIYVDIFAIAIVLAREPEVRADAADNFLLFLDRNSQAEKLTKAYAGLNTSLDDLTETKQRVENLQGQLQKSNADNKLLQKQLADSRTKLKAAEAELTTVTQKLETIEKRNAETAERLNKQLRNFTNQSR